MAASLMATSGLNARAFRLRAPTSQALRVAPVAVQRRSRKVSVKAVASMDPVSRVLGAIPYLLPFIDAWTCGRYLFVDYPGLRNMFSPLFPMISSYHSMAFLPIIVFFSLYIGVVGNGSMFSRFVRFNVMQALLLDVLLVLPRLIESLVQPPSFGWGHELYMFSQTFLWIFTTAWVVYCVVNCLLGNFARIPYVAESAEEQVR